MTAHYLEGLKRRAAELKERRTTEKWIRSRSLDERIRHWYEELPSRERKLNYRMRDLVLLFGGSPAMIGEALWRLGWKRTRYWRREGPSRRVWEPPN